MPSDSSRNRHIQYSNPRLSVQQPFHSVQQPSRFSTATLQLWFCNLSTEALHHIGIDLALYMRQLKVFMVSGSGAALPRRKRSVDCNLNNGRDALLRVLFGHRGRRGLRPSRARFESLKVGKFESLVVSSRPERQTFKPSNSQTFKLPLS